MPFIINIDFLIYTCLAFYKSIIRKNMFLLFYYLISVFDK